MRAISARREVRTMRYGVVFVSLGLLGMLGCEGAPRCPSGMSAEDGRCVCDEPRYFDADGDGYGSGPRLASCELGPSIVTVAGDCDDRDPARHPGAAEVCNGQDDDCDGEIDEDF